MRRVVLASSPAGKSQITKDSSPLGIYLMPARNTGDAAMPSARPRSLQESVTWPAAGELELAELFGSARGIAELAEDTSGDVENWLPGVDPGGFKIRVATFGPGFEAPLHSSHSFDIDVVLRGEITVVTEMGDEAVLRAGDSVVIPGVGHAWKVGAEGCRMVIMMFGTE